MAHAVAHTRRNPGPSWGYAFLTQAERLLPRPALEACLDLGAQTAVRFMAAQRNASAEYLAALWGRPATRDEIDAHFRAFVDSLMAKLRLGRGLRPHFAVADVPEKEGFLRLCRTDRPALFGTMHVGHCDLMGASLSEFGRQIHMLRLRVGNSLDTDLIERHFGQDVRFIWVNEPSQYLWELKQTMEAGHTVALQADRLEFGSKRAAFDFLGARRWFPFTLYYLAHLYQRPVAFAFAVPLGPDRVQVVPSAVLEPQASRAAALEAGREHFQSVLRLLESILRGHPYIWFNFLPLNEQAVATAPLPAIAT
ncbi:MAG: hypothetical protein Q7P63_14790 [Verrucomicrobiota bacterium JB022]|nr:hypothetical protein [Verrucomicrobiota bacterium JB022]